jgi:hypothetical protein
MTIKRTCACGKCDTKAIKDIKKIINESNYNLVLYEDKEALIKEIKEKINK